MDFIMLVQMYFKLEFIFLFQPFVWLTENLFRGLTCSTQTMKWIFEENKLTIYNHRSTRTQYLYILPNVYSLITYICTQTVQPFWNKIEQLAHPSSRTNCPPSAADSPRPGRPNSPVPFRRRWTRPGCPQWCPECPPPRSICCSWTHTHAHKRHVTYAFRRRTSKSNLLRHIVVHRIKVLGDRRVRVAERYRPEPVRRLVCVRMLQPHIVQAGELVELLAKSTHTHAHTDTKAHAEQGKQERNNTETKEPTGTKTRGQRSQFD